jgi:hypothetical protein
MDQDPQSFKKPIQYEAMMIAQKSGVAVSPKELLNTIPDFRNPSFFRAWRVQNAKCQVQENKRSELNIRIKILTDELNRLMR